MQEKINKIQKLLIRKKNIEDEIKEIDSVNVRDIFTDESRSRYPHFYLINKVKLVELVENFKGGYLEELEKEKVNQEILKYEIIKK